MNSRSSKTKLSTLNLVIVPSYCVANEESAHLAEKREAQLEWMRAKGMTYLGDPTKPPVVNALRRPRPTAPIRLVSVRRRATMEAADDPGELAREA